MTKKTRGASLGAKVRELRRGRRLTQQQLASLLGITQGYLSRLERGDGEFSADQLIEILKFFNVPIDHFAPKSFPAEDQLQNSLARLGASHLIENEQILPSDRLKAAIDSIREALISGESSRQVTGIAPILVEHAGNISLTKLHTDFVELGLEFRLGWLIDCTLEALKREEAAKGIPTKWRLKYRRARILIESFTASWREHPGAPGKPPAYAIFDPNITSEETLKDVKANLSPIARRWRIITEIRVEDFVRALRAARGAD